RLSQEHARNSCFLLFRNWFRHALPVSVFLEMTAGTQPTNLPDMVARIALRPNVRQMAAFPGSEYPALLTESVGIVVSLSPQIAHLDPGKPDRSQLARLAQRLRPLGCREGTAGARDHRSSP